VDSFNLADAKAHLSKLVDLVEAGGSIDITRCGKPVAQLTPVARPPHADRLGHASGPDGCHAAPGAGCRRTGPIDAGWWSQLMIYLETSLIGVPTQVLA